MTISAVLSALGVLLIFYLAVLAVLAVNGRVKKRRNDHP